jgi:hypothetical protein
MSRGRGLVYHACGHQTPVPGADRQSAEACSGCRSAIGPRQVGGRYHCGYWGEDYTVEAIDVHDSLLGGWAMTVRWADGHRTRHCTAWEARRDRIIEEGRA